MKKLMILLGSVLFTVAVLTSCGGNDPEADAKADWECNCDAAKESNIEKKLAAEAKCEELAKENSSKYDDNEKAFAKYQDAKTKLVGKACK